MIKKKRKDMNFEVLRSISMYMIIILHFFSMGIGLGEISIETNYFIFSIIYSSCIFGVNTFILITGYYSGNEKYIKVRKIFNLLCTVSFWGILIYLVSLLITKDAFDIRILIKSIFPYFFGLKWFVKSYLILLCFIPFLNILLVNLTKRNFLILISILLIFFSIWSSFLPDAPVTDNGYGITNFILLYTIGYFIRKFDFTITKRYSSLITILSIMFMVTLAQFHLVKNIWAYNNIWVITGSVSLFLYFKQLNFNINNSIIKFLTSCTFGVYLIHSDINIQEFVWNKGIKACFGESYFILTLLVYAFIIYVLCSFINYLVERILNKVIKYIIEKIHLLNILIEN